MGGNGEEMRRRRGIFIRIWRRSEVSRENRIIQWGRDEKNRWQGITWNYLSSSEGVEVREGKFSWGWVVFSSTTQSVVYRMYSGYLYLCTCIGVCSHQGDIKRRKNIKNVRVDFFCVKGRKIIMNISCVLFGSPERRVFSPITLQFHRSEPVGLTNLPVNGICNSFMRRMWECVLNIRKGWNKNRTTNKGHSWGLFAFVEKRRRRKWIRLKVTGFEFAEWKTQTRWNLNEREK